MSAIHLTPNSRISNAVYLVVSIPAVLWFFTTFFPWFDTLAVSDVRGAIAIVLVVSSFVAAGLFYLRPERGIGWIIKELTFKKHQKILNRFTVTKRIVNQEWHIAIAEKWETPLAEVKSNLKDVMNSSDMHDDIWTVFGMFYFLGGASFSCILLVDLIPEAERTFMGHQIYSAFFVLVVLVIISVLFSKRNLAVNLCSITLFRGLQETLTMVQTRETPANETSVRKWQNLDSILGQLNEIILRKDVDRFRRRFNQLMDSFELEFKKNMSDLIEGFIWYYAEILISSTNEEELSKQDRKQIDLVREIINTFYPFQLDESSLYRIAYLEMKSILEFELKETGRAFFVDVLLSWNGVEYFQKFESQILKGILNHFPLKSGFLSDEEFISIADGISLLDIWEQCRGLIFSEFCKFTDSESISYILKASFDWGDYNWQHADFYIVKELPNLIGTVGGLEKIQTILKTVLSRDDPQFIANTLNLFHLSTLDLNTCLELVTRQNDMIDLAFVAMMERYVLDDSSILLVDMFRYHTPSYKLKSGELHLTTVKSSLNTIRIYQLILEFSITQDKSIVLQIIERFLVEKYHYFETFSPCIALIRDYGDQKSLSFLHRLLYPESTISDDEIDLTVGTLPVLESENDFKLQIRKAIQSMKKRLAQEAFDDK
ncbi:MAG: hypothetical protein ACTSV2_16100 [Candidatus Thorarchaeota archaeon]